MAVVSNEVIMRFFIKLAEQLPKIVNCNQFIHLLATI